MKEIKLNIKIGGKALPRLGGNDKIPADIPHLRHHHDDGPNTDGAGTAKTVNGLFIHGMNLKTNFVQKLQPTQFTVTDGGSKEHISKYRKLATETLQRKL